MTNPNLTARRMLRLSALLEVLSAAGAAGAAGAAAAGTRSVLEAGAASTGKRLINNSPTASSLDPLAGFVNITVFHVNPSTFGVAPINMDTADLLGDMYFDMRSKTLPIECASGSRHNDCRNPEVAAKGLVITKIVLTVDPAFGAYSSCNVCVNGTDPYGKEKCTDGVYTCSCSDKPCGQAVGQANISGAWVNQGCPTNAPDWKCWQGNVAKKIGGSWYSTLDSGYCGDGTRPPPPGCTWKVAELVKQVSKNCSDNTIYNVVEKVAGGGQNRSCFESCDDSGVGPHRRNTSSPCWIECFYGTVLGPDADRHGGKLAGMPLADLVAAWNLPFASDDTAIGGCPAIKPNPADRGSAESSATTSRVAGASQPTGPAAFPESRLITPPQGALLNSWANQTTGQEWTLCYTSTTMSTASPAEFHKGCDQYKPTVTVARNSGGRGVCGKCSSDAPRGCRGTCSTGGDCWPLSSPCGATNKGGFTFGGFADATWSGGTSGSDPFSGANKGTNATFLFGLGPGTPARYGPTSALCPKSPKMCSDKVDPNGGCPNLERTNCSCCLCSNINDCERTIYQFAKPDLWPNWGYNGMGTADLDMGGPPSIRGPPGLDSTALGANAECTTFMPNIPMSGLGPFVKDMWAFNGPGSTYTGPTNHDGCASDPAGCLSLCGGSGNWGETELEVWRLA